MLTQDQVAVLSEIDSSNICIAEALKITPGDLLDGVRSDMFRAPAEDRRRVG